MFAGKKILLGITGSIAAYKSAFLLRLLKNEGADVQVITTPAGKEFITPVTMSALSGNPVESSFFANEDGTWHSHVDMGNWADFMIIAPVTASSIAKMVTGQADNLLITTYLSAKCPVFVAPAMDLHMYNHVTTQRNLKQLMVDGVHVLESQEGGLASGLSGKGRMMEPQQIIDEIYAFFQQEELKKKSLLNKKILVTAGPTRENIDPVRYLSNRSSGKMGYAIVEKLLEAGAEVWLISGPVSINMQNDCLHVLPVESASDMFNLACELFPEMDGAVLAAAVSDYRPETIHEKKVKSDQDRIQINFIKNPDIADKLGAIKRKNQFLVGFALETDNELVNAKNKMVKKNLDLIFLNSLNVPYAGFDYDTNKVTAIDQDNNIHEFELKDKKKVASDVVALISKICLW